MGDLHPQKQQQRQAMNKEAHSWRRIVPGAMDSDGDGEGDGVCVCVD